MLHFFRGTVADILRELREEKKRKQLINFCKRMVEREFVEVAINKCVEGLAWTTTHESRNN